MAAKQVLTLVITSACTHGKYHMHLLRHRLTPIKNMAWTYVAWTDPTNTMDSLRAVILFSTGMPQVAWSPNLNSNGEMRVYTDLGKTNLTDAAWTCPTNSGHRFFKVKVELP